MCARHTLREPSSRTEAVACPRCRDKWFSRSEICDPFQPSWVLESPRGKKEIQMKRQLLWTVMVVWLCTACATRHPSEAQVLASRIVREGPSTLSCKIGDVRYCEPDVDGLETPCACIDHAM